MKHGFIKIHRKIMDWEWYDDKNTFILFMHCLLKANHKDKNYHGEVIEKGSFLTSYQLLATETRLSVRSIRTSLERLKSTHELTVKTTNKGTQIFVNKWEDYQCQEEESDTQNDTQLDTQATHKRQTSDKQTTTNKNDKNVKNDKNIKESVKEKFSPPTLTDLNSYCQEKGLNVDTERFLNYYTSNGWMVGRNKMKDWRATLRNWAKDNRDVKPGMEIKPEYDTSQNQTYSQTEIEERMRVLRNEM